MRALIVVCLLCLIIPMARASVPHLPLLFSPFAAKMDAEGTTAALTRHLSRFQKREPEIDVRCEPHAQTSDWSPGRDGAWDFICTYVDQPRSYHPKRLKVGVRVGADRLLHVSPPHELETQYVRW